MAMIIILSVSVILLIILSGIFSASDMVYAVVNQLRLKKDVEKGSKVSKLALKYAKDYDTTITTILFSNNLVNIAATSLSTILGYYIFEFAKNLDKWSILYTASPTIMSIVLVVTLLIFGEILPKVIGRAYSYPLSKIMAYPLFILKIIFFPIVFISSKIGALFALPFSPRNKEKLEKEEISDEELNKIVETIQEEGIIDEEQEELVKSAITFKDTEAHEIMTPSPDIFALDIDGNINEALLSDEAFVHYRIPVYKDNIDNIIGVLPTKTLLRSMLAKQKITRKSIESILLKPHYVPFSMGISEILEDMKKSKNHVVIVKDEYGATAGLLTMEDILEELVGEIFDEMDDYVEEYTKIKRNSYEVEGSMNIEDFFALVDVDAPENLDVTTVGGWCLDSLERFATVGDKFTYKNLKVTILEVGEFTVEKILVKVSKKKVN